jgi:hypothetical protein
MFVPAPRTTCLLLRTDEVVFALATFSVKEWRPAFIEVFQLVGERMVHTDY